MSDKFLKVECPSCHRRLKVFQSKRHKKVLCPRCNSLFFVELPGDREPSTRLVPNRNKLFGPPVHRDFIRAEMAESEASDSSELGDSANEVPLGKAYPFEDLPVDDLVNRETSRGPTELIEIDKAVTWKMEHSEIQTSFDEACQRYGIGLVIFSVAILIVPLLHFQWLRIQPAIQAMQTIGVALGTLGVAMVALSMRRKWRRALATLMAQSLLIAALYVYTRVDGQRFEKNNSELARLTRDQEQSSAQDTDADQHDLEIGRTIIENNPAERFVPPKTSMAPRTIKGDRDLELPPPLERFNRLPVSKSRASDSESTVDRSALSSTFRPNDESYVTPPIVGTLNTASPFENHREAFKSAAQLASEFAQATSLFQRVEAVLPREPDMSKRQVLIERTRQMNKGLVNHFEIKTKHLADNYQLSDSAGVSTVFGVAHYRDLPIMGIDVCSNNDNGLDQIVPVGGPREFDDALVGEAGYFLVGLSINYDNEVIGIQANFAPAENGVLDMARQVSSPWYGTPPSRQSTRSINSNGRPVYGIVVYRNQLKIVGVSLVTSR